MTTGLTHLVEHLAMSGVPDLRRHSHNATVGPTFTSFTCSGKAETVATFLAAVCSFLSVPDLGRLEIEKKILAAEASTTVPPATAEHLRHRFGLSSLGLTDVSPPSLGTLGPDEVLQLLRSHFTAGNAALALSGAPPEGLRLDLPAGSPRRPHSPAALAASLPMWFEQGWPRLGLSFEVPAGTEALREAARTVSRIACRRAHRTLRQEQGWVYDVDVMHFLDSGDTGILCFETDPTPQHADDARLGLMAILRDLRLNGPTAGELQADAEEFQEYLEDSSSAIEMAVAAAEAHLLGREPVSPPDKLALAHGVTAEACRAALASLEATAIFGMPEGTRPDDDSIRSDSDRTIDWLGGREFRRSVRGALYGVPGGSKLFVGEKGVTLSADYTASITWDDLVGVAVAPDGLVSLIGIDCQQIQVREAWFGKGQQAIDAILDRAGEERCFTPPDA
ncbi:insulinase family protein [Arthrobacter globiformis]|uniref:insulinase family protein n=1 Tax=Arthrobacter globiformis TaxID=1665 RepID=UPI00397E85C9